MQFSRGRGGFPRGGGGFRGGPRGGSFTRGRGGPRGGGFRGRGDGRPSPYSARGEDTRTINPTKLHVSNVPEGVTSSELESIFEKCGKVLECDVIRDFAFVHYKSSAEADAAVEQLHGYEIAGSTINVRHSTSTLRQKPGTHKGDCFRCGGRGHSSVECPTELREKGLLPPMTMASTYRGGFDSFDPYDMPAADPYFDPYERMETDPFYRRRVAAALAADPYLGGGAPRGMSRGGGGDPYARGRGRGAAAAATEAADPYARPPPEFYQRRGRGRGAAAAAAGYGGANGSSYGRAPNRPANDPYFYNDDYEKSAENGSAQAALNRLQNVLETGLLSSLPL